MGPKIAANGTPLCAECQKTDTMLWHALDTGQLCHECHELRSAAQKPTPSTDADERPTKEREPAEGEEKAKSTAEEKRLRKSTRATRFKPKASAGSNSVALNGAGTHSTGAAGGSNGAPAGGGGANKPQNKGRNRRSMFKKAPKRAPVTQAITHIVESVFYKGSYLQVGDIVSLVDGDGGVYYAQIRGLLVDNYCEKSAYLTWLIPTQASPDPADGFDAATYLIGPDEELSRKLSCLEFVMHAPSNYYWDRTTPYPLPDHMECDVRPGGYIWTTMPEYQRRKTAA